MIKYIHKKASIIIFQFMLYTIINISYCHHVIILYNQGNSQCHWGALTQIITNWVSTTGTNSIRGELQETNLSGLKSK